jgi:hypothetical protein
VGLTVKALVYAILFPILIRCTLGSRLRLINGESGCENRNALSAPTHDELLTNLAKPRHIGGCRRKYDEPTSTLLRAGWKQASSSAPWSVYSCSPTFLNMPNDSRTGTSVLRGMLGTHRSAPRRTLSIMAEEVAFLQAGNSKGKDSDLSVVCSMRLPTSLLETKILSPRMSTLPTRHVATSHHAG